MARLASRLRREPDDVSMVLPFDDVVTALGRESERALGLQVIEIASIVGSVDRTRDFDLRFRPTSARVRQRWQSIDAASRRGEPLPPIDVYRIGDLHFVKDGHHRVSVARALGLQTIDAYTTEVRTRLPAKGIRRRGDLITKDYERIFRARVPLPASAYAKIAFADPWDFAQLAEAVEAWGFRATQHEGAYLDRIEVARRWYDSEYRPVVRMSHEAGLGGKRSDAETYLLVISERYRLIRTHDWSEDIVEQLRHRLI